MSLMEKLLALYRVDAQVRGLRKRLDAAQQYLNTQIALFNNIKQELEELHTRRRHVQATIANLETEITGIDNQLEKFRADLNTASTNKQYTAVLTEMNTVKEQRSKTEDQMLQHMEQVESLDAQIAEVGRQLEERAKVQSHAEAQLAERQGEVGERLAELETERREAAAAVPGPQLGVFNEMAEIYDGEAMSVIVEIDRRHHEYVCDACHMRITFEQVANALSSTNELVRCTACGRLLFMKEELRGALMPK